MKKFLACLVMVIGAEQAFASLTSLLDITKEIVRNVNYQI
jgi:hypothetical protein